MLSNGGSSSGPRCCRKSIGNPRRRVKGPSSHERRLLRRLERGSKPRSVVVGCLRSMRGGAAMVVVVATIVIVPIVVVVRLGR